MSTHWDRINERNIIQFGPDWYHEMAMKLGSTVIEIENNKHILQPRDMPDSWDLTKRKHCPDKNCDWCKNFDKQRAEMMESIKQKPRQQTPQEANEILKYYGCYSQIL